MRRKVCSLVLFLFLAFSISLLGQKVLVQAALNQPVITVATKNGHPQVKITAVNGATGYRIYRKNPTDESWIKVATTKKTSYVDTRWNTNPGQKVRYTVKAYYKNAAGKVTWSKAAATVAWTVPETSGFKTISAAKLPDGLEDFLARFAWNVASREEYSCNKNAASILDRMLTTDATCDYSIYPVKRTEQAADVIFDADGFDWILKNIYNFPDSEIKALKKSGNVTYVNGTYKSFLGGVGGGYQVRNISAKTNGKLYRITYDIYDYSFEKDAYVPYDGNRRYALMEYKTIGGKGYWSIYQDTSHAAYSQGLKKKMTSEKARTVLKKDLVTYLKERFNTDASSSGYMDSFFSYQMIKTRSGYGDVYLVNWGIFRLTGGTALVFPDQSVVYDTDSAYSQYEQLLNCKLVNESYRFDHFDEFRNDLTYETDGE